LLLVKVVLVVYKVLQDLKVPRVYKELLALPLQLLTTISREVLLIHGLSHIT
jgi:hypothetical protein